MLLGIGTCLLVLIIKLLLSALLLRRRAMGAPSWPHATTSPGAGLQAAPAVVHHTNLRGSEAPPGTWSRVRPARAACLHGTAPARLGPAGAPKPTCFPFLGHGPVISILKRGVQGDIPLGHVAWA